MICGFSIGAALGGLIAAPLLAYGWAPVFYMGGIAPLLLLPILAVALPESVRLLVINKRPTEEVIAILTKINPRLRFGSDTRFVTAEEKLAGTPVKHLFTEGRALATLLLWLAFFANLVGLYFITSWLPTVIHDAGIPVSQAVIATAMFQVGGTIGAISLGRLIDRFGSRGVLAATFVMAGVFIAAIGSAGPSVAWITAIVFGAGFCVVGGQIGIDALAGAYYPTFIRSTGVGWVPGVGRLGSVVGPLLGSILLTMKWPLSLLFDVAAIPALVAAAAIFLMGRVRSSHS